MNRNYFYANSKQEEITTKGVIQVGNIIFINLGLILFHSGNSLEFYVLTLWIW